MKYGAVCSPGTATNPSNYYVQADLLYRMHATTARVSMFFESPESRRYDNQGLDTLRGAGLTEMIIQSSETADAGLADRELSLCQDYIDAHPETLFVFELGNEPNQTTDDAATARSKRLTTIRDVKPKYAVRPDGSPRSNLLWAINMPSQNDDGSYFNAFVNDFANDGLGNLLTGPNQPDVVTVHCYGFATLCRGDSQAPYKLIDWVRGYTDKNIKVTESGIFDGITVLPDSVRGPRYVEFAEKVSASGGGNLDSVCFYGTPEVESWFTISGGLADTIGSRASANDCG
jgi:hypothetical protein